MEIEAFLKDLQDELEFESIKIELKTILKDCDEWDSMTALVLMAYASSNFDINLNAKDIEEIGTVESLAKKLGLL
jgi:acyl carrier protein